MEFDMFGLSDEVARAVADLGYETPTPIQINAIPPMLQGRDVIGQAQTGTGKTAAFGIPLAEKIEPGERCVQALVLSPTRELAVQTAGELTKLTRYREGVRVLPVYGGAPIERQLRELEAGVQVVVGTPGRVMDHMRRGSLDLSRVKLAILDEADEMLDMGFREDIETILAATPESRQTALFSATMPTPILALARKYLRDPSQVEVERREMTVEKIAQYYISVRSFHKSELLSRLLTLENIRLALVFCNTKQGVETVVTDLQHRGFSAAGLHGDMRQIERDAVMARYRHGLVNVLVATDVAARGLDIDDIEAVFNYDIPLDVEYYVHRVGRTGRAGKEGRAYTFVVGREVARMWDYRRITGAKILCRKAPNAVEVQQALSDRMMEEITSRAQAELDDALLRRAADLLQRTEPDKAVAAMLDLLIREAGARADVSIDLDPPEPPRPVRPAPAPVPRRGPYGRPVPRDMLPKRAAMRSDTRPSRGPERSDRSGRVAREPYARQKDDRLPAREKRPYAPRKRFDISARPHRHGRDGLK